MKKIFILLIVIISILPIDSFAKAKVKAKHTIKLATLMPRDTSGQMDQFLKAIQEQTHNEVAFKIYFGGVQGDEKNVLRKIRMKQLHGGAITGHGLEEIVPEVRVTDLPYLFWNNEEIDYVRDHLEEEMNQRFEAKGFVVLGWGEAGFVYTFSKIPITSIEIAKEQKWWIWEGDTIGLSLTHEIGITPIQLSFTDVLTSLSSNLIDTAGTTPFSAIAFRWYTKFDYMDAFPVLNPIAAWVVRKDIWDEISLESRTTIRSLMKSNQKKSIQEIRKSNYKSLSVLKKMGIKIVPVDLEHKDGQFILNCAKKTREALIGKLYSQEMLDKTLSLLNEYRTQHPESQLMMIE